MLHPIARLWLAGLVLLICRPALAAEQSALTGPLTLRTAIAAALARNPELALTQYSLQAGEARVAQANLRPAPQLALELQDFAGTHALRGVDALETTLSLSQVIELGDKRGLRSAAARADLELVGIERQTQQLDLLAEVTRRFIAVVVAQQQRSQAQRASELGDALLQAIEARVAAARSPEAERSRASVSALRARLELAHADSELRQTRRALAALWGGAEAGFSEAQADLFTFPVLLDYATLQNRLQANPDALRFASETRQREAQLRLAEAQTRPNLNFSVGVRQQQATESTALVAGISMPLRMADRSAAAIREAEALQRQSAARQQSVLRAAEATLYGLYQEALAARAAATALHEEALPQAGQALEQTRYGYERGRFSWLELAAAQNELLELQAAATTRAADAHRLQTEIERLTGEPLTADATETAP